MDNNNNNNNNRSPDTNSLCDLGQVTTYLNLIFYLSNRKKNPLCQAQLSLRIKINREAYWKNTNKYYYLLWIYMVKSLRHQARLIHALSPSSWALGSRPAGPTKTMQLMDTTPGWGGTLIWKVPDCEEQWYPAIWSIHIETVTWETNISVLLATVGLDFFVIAAYPN